MTLRPLQESPSRNWEIVTTEGDSKEPQWTRLDEEVVAEAKKEEKASCTACTLETKATHSIKLEEWLVYSYLGCVTKMWMFVTP